jgi:hypothetical protein
MRAKMCKGVPHGVRRQIARAAESVAFALIFALVPALALPQSQSSAPNSPAPSASQTPAPAPTDAAPPPPPALTNAPDSGKGRKDKGDKNDQPAAIQSWLRIEVVGGVDKKAVQQASVYVKFTVVRKVGKDQKFEFDFKTNDDGVARAPDIPQGKILIQIVATGWKSFGQYYDVVQDNQTIHIELERPPRWY